LNAGNLYPSGGYGLVQPIKIDDAAGVSFMHNYRTDLSGTAVTGTSDAPYKGDTLVTDDVVQNTSTSDVTDLIYRVSVTPSVNRTLSFVNDAGEDVSAYVGSPTYTYFNTQGVATSDISKATWLEISGLKFTAGTSFHIRIQRDAQYSFSGTPATIQSRLGHYVNTTDANGNSVPTFNDDTTPPDIFYWSAVVPLQNQITMPFNLYENKNGTLTKVASGNDVTGTILSESKITASSGKQTALYKVDLSNLTMPSGYTLESKYTDTIYALVTQIQSNDKIWANYSSIVTTDVSTATDSTAVATMTINGVDTPVYPFAVSLDQYNTDKNASLDYAGTNSKASYAPLTMLVSSTVSGNIQFTDKDGNQVGDLVPFADQQPGTAVDVSTLTAPKNYDFNTNLDDTSLTNDTYQSGTVKVYVTRVTDDAYDSSNVTTETNKGLLNHGMQIINAPDYSGSDRVGSLKSTLTPSAGLSYLNMYGKSLSLYMSATSLTGTVLSKQLSVSSITVPDESGQTVDIYDGSNSTSIPASGAKVGTITGRKGEFTLPDMTVNLSFTSFADTYKGKINYMLVDDSGTVTN
jgi:hypothetical protein